MQEVREKEQEILLPGYDTAITTTNSQQLAIACTGLAHKEACQQPGMDEGAEGSQPLSAELLATDIFWDREVVAFSCISTTEPIRMT